MSTTKIEWTATRLPDGKVLPGYTFNPWIGCTKVSEGCKNCYAEADFDKRRGIAKWGANGTRIVTSYAYWRNLIKWNKQAKESGIKRKVFVGSLCDIFEDWKGQMLNSKGEKLVMNFRYEEPTCFDYDGVPSFYSDEYVKKYLPSLSTRYMTMQGIRNSLFELIPQLDGLIFIFCTKRPENWRCVPESWQYNGFPKNVWVLTSVENQEQLDIRVPKLLEIPAAIRGLSVEPMMGPIDLKKSIGGTLWIGGQRGCDGTHRHSGKAGEILHGIIHDTDPNMPHHHHDERCNSGINWVIAGGESGPKAQPTHPDWFRSLRDQCVEAGVPFFFKQWGEYAPLNATGNAWAEYRDDGDKYLTQLHGIVPVKWFGEKFTPGSTIMYRVGKKAAGRLLDGLEWSEMPE